MSQRTVAEVNHDIAKIDPGDAIIFVRQWNVAIASGCVETWKPLERWGIRRIERLHHSDDHKFVVTFGSGTVHEIVIG